MDPVIAASRRYVQRVPINLAAQLAVLALAPGAAPSWPLIPSPVATIVRSACPDGSGTECAYRQTRTVYAPPWVSRFAVEHGLGHLYDDQRLDDGERAKLRRLLGLPTGAWRTGTGIAGLSSPSEWFADAYAACRLRMDPETRWEVAYDYQPSRRQHARVCATISRASD